MLSRHRASLVFLSATFWGCTGTGNGNHERPAASYDPQTGRLERLVFDSNDDGRNDAAGVLDGTRVKQIELDSNGNGTVDRWDFYDAGGKIVKVGLSRADDGVMDAVAVYASDQRLQQLEVSTRRDGRFDRIEFYEAGQLTRAEEDTDADGLVDKWESYRPNVGAGPGEPPVVLSTVAFDDDKRGRPSRRLVYALDGQVARVEHDPRGDGTFGDTRATDAASR
jgi:hypothetical protein